MGAEIYIWNKVLIGVDVEISDDDGHLLSPLKRHLPSSATKPIRVEDNVLIGNHARSFKVVTIGENSIIGNSAVVTKNVPSNVVVAGNPARIVRVLDSHDTKANS